MYRTKKKLMCSKRKKLTCSTCLLRHCLLVFHQDALHHNSNDGEARKYTQKRLKISQAILVIRKKTSFTSAAYAAKAIHELSLSRHIIVCTRERSPTNAPSVRSSSHSQGDWTPISPLIQVSLKDCESNCSLVLKTCLILLPEVVGSNPTGVRDFFFFSVCTHFYSRAIPLRKYHLGYLYSTSTYHILITIYDLLSLVYNRQIVLFTLGPMTKELYVEL